MVMCPCCGKIKAIERRYQNDGGYQPAKIYLDMDGNVCHCVDARPPGNE